MFVPVKGRPAPCIRWTKDGSANLGEQVLIDSTDFATTLIIQQTTRDDSGKYTLHLDNSSGSISASCNVKVLDTPGPCHNLNASFSS